jgi:hypothetical protein
MPPSSSPNDVLIRFGTFCYRELSLSGTWYVTNIGTFRRFSAPVWAPFDAAKTGVETSRMRAGSAGFERLNGS